MISPNFLLFICIVVSLGVLASCSEESPSPTFMQQESKASATAPGSVNGAPRSGQIPKTIELFDKL